MKKILIIEDEEYLSEMYKIKFTQEGYKTVVARDGEEGLIMAEKEKPDLILLDLRLPKMDGYQVLDKLRSGAVSNNTKIYILSNLGQTDEVNRSFKEGADGYFIKANLTPTQLVDKVKSIFAGQQISANAPAIKNGARRNAAPVQSGIQPLNRKGSVLLIEDEDDIVSMYKMRLEKEGYGVAAAKNGAWGLKLAREKKFDIIVMDMVMPAMDGYAAIKKLKEGSKTKSVPVIVLSNSAQDRDIDKAKQCGAACYLLKSRITPAKLIKEINKFFNN